MPKKKNPSACESSGRELIADRNRQVLALLEDLELNSQVDVVAMTVSTLLLRDASTPDGPCSHQALLLFSHLVYEIMQDAKARLREAMEAQSGQPISRRTDH